jgi:hypothetical protein
MSNTQNMTPIGEIQNTRDLEVLTRIPERIVKARWNGDVEKAERDVHHVLTDDEAYSKMIRWCERNDGSDTNDYGGKTNAPGRGDFDWRKHLEKRPVLQRATAIRYLDWKLRKEMSGSVVDIRDRDRV